MGELRLALTDEERGLGAYHAEADDEALEHIAFVANGDMRTALNAIELAVRTTEPGDDGVIRIDKEIAAESIQRKVARCDDQQLYDMLSAFCKSLRGGDSNAALAWFSRLIYAGLDPRIICRRMIAHSSEDVGLANPTALQQAVAAAQALGYLAAVPLYLALRLRVEAYLLKPVNFDELQEIIDSLKIKLSKLPAFQDAPEGAAPRPTMPLASVTSASTVGLPRESTISRPMILVMAKLLSRPVCIL